MILEIDTSEINTTKVYLKDSMGKTVKILEETRIPGSQALLSMIKKILKLKRLDFKDLSGVEVATGPGSFTGLRVGVSVANALGYALKVPVNGKKIGQLVIPKYDNL